MAEALSNAENKKIPTKRLSIDDIFCPQTNKINLETLKAHLFEEGRVDDATAIKIMNECATVFKSESNLLKIDAPAIICGDIHGQFYDLLKIFEIGGSVEDTRYLFLGDYVDRGSFSIEVVLYLWALKLMYPDRMFLLRGNHECRHLTEHFSFKKECQVKYSEAVYNACMESFDCLPLAAVLNKQLFCVHGGISPDIKTLEDVEKIDRFMEPPVSGPMCDLLWSDPEPDFDTKKSTKDFKANTVRGCSYSYSYKACSDFIARNNLICIVRAHEVKEAGHFMAKKHEVTNFPVLITIFSAPNYCDAYQNHGAIIKYEKDNLNIRQFRESPHPFWLPNFQDVISWSLPFALERVTDFMKAIWSLSSKEEREADKQKAERNNRIKAKMLAVGKVANVLSEMREANENAVELKGLAPTPNDEGNTPRVLRSERKRINSFDEAKEFDQVNEKRPAQRI